MGLALMPLEKLEHGVAAEPGHRNIMLLSKRSEAVELGVRKVDGYAAFGGGHGCLQQSWGCGPSALGCSTLGYRVADQRALVNCASQGREKRFWERTGAPLKTPAPPRMFAGRSSPSQAVPH